MKKNRKILKTDCLDVDIVPKNQNYVLYGCLGEDIKLKIMKNIFNFAIMIEQSIKYAKKHNKKNIIDRFVENGYSKKYLVKIYNDFRKNNIDDLNRWFETIYPNPPGKMEMIKFFGAYKTEEKLIEVAKKIKKKKKDSYPLHYTKGGYWSPFDPNEEYINKEKSTVTEDKMNDLMKGRIVKNLESKEYLDKRVESIKKMGQIKALKLEKKKKKEIEKELKINVDQIEKDYSKVKDDMEIENMLKFDFDDEKDPDDDSKLIQELFKNKEYSKYLSNSAKGLYKKK